MGSTTFPAPPAGKTPKVLTLTSGTSWTVPAGVSYVNVRLFGGGGGGGGDSYTGSTGGTTTFTGATSAAGGIGSPIDSGTAALNKGGVGGRTSGGSTNASDGDVVASNVNVTAGASITYAIGAGGAKSAYGYGSAGGAGKIEIEYWV